MHRDTHARGFDSFKGLACLCHSLTLGLDDLCVVHEAEHQSTEKGKQRRDVIWLEAFNLLGTEFKR